MELSESAKKVVGLAQEVRELDAQIKDRELTLQLHKEAERPLRIHAVRRVPSNSLGYYTDVINEFTSTELENIHDHLVFVMGSALSRKKVKRNDLIAQINQLVREDTNDTAEPAEAGSD